MQLGIFAKTFPRPTFNETLEVVSSHGLRCVQFNFSCVGLATLPDHIAPDLLAQVRQECARHEISVAGVSGTFNLIDPNVEKRRSGLARLPLLAKATRELGCDLMTLCTGTRDENDMWRAHPENCSPAAWRDLMRSLEEAIAVAETHGVRLGIEPESGNVVSSARKARQLLDELQSSHVKIVLDPANLFHGGRVERIRETIREAFQLLGTEIVMAHAKELTVDGAIGNVPAGRGVLDWNYYVGTLTRMEFRGPLVIHGLDEADAPQAIRFLRAKLMD